MLAFAVFATLLVAASAAAPFVSTDQLDQLANGFQYRTMMGHPVVANGAIYPGTYAAGAYPYGVHGAYPYNYNTYPYSAYPYNYNTAPVVQSVPAVSAVAVKPMASNVHFKTFPSVQHPFVQPITSIIGQTQNKHIESPVYYTTAGAYPQYQQFGVNPWNYAVAH